MILILVQRYVYRRPWSFSVCVGERGRGGEGIVCTCSKLCWSVRECPEAVSPEAIWVPALEVSVTDAGDIHVYRMVPTQN